MHELTGYVPPAPHALAGYVAAPGTDRGDVAVRLPGGMSGAGLPRGLWDASVIERVDHPRIRASTQYRDRHRSRGGGTGRTAAGLTSHCASKLLTLEYD
jgi:hypothetical protein